METSVNPARVPRDYHDLIIYLTYTLETIKSILLEHGYQVQCNVSNKCIMELLLLKRIKRSKNIGLTFKQY